MNYKLREANKKTFLIGRFSFHQNRQNTVSAPASNYYEIVCNEIHVRASKCKWFIYLNNLSDSKTILKK